MTSSEEDHRHGAVIRRVYETVATPPRDRLEVQHRTHQRQPPSLNATIRTRKATECISATTPLLSAASPRPLPVTARPERNIISPPPPKKKQDDDYVDVDEVVIANSSDRLRWPPAALDGRNGPLRSSTTADVHHDVRRYRTRRVGGPTPSTSSSANCSDAGDEAAPPHLLSSNDEDADVCLRLHVTGCGSTATYDPVTIRTATNASEPIQLVDDRRRLAVFRTRSPQSSITDSRLQQPLYVRRTMRAVDLPPPPGRVSGGDAVLVRSPRSDDDILPRDVRTGYHRQIVAQYVPQVSDSEWWPAGLSPCAVPAHPSAEPRVRGQATAGATPPVRHHRTSGNKPFHDRRSRSLSSSSRSASSSSPARTRVTIQRGAPDVRHRSPYYHSSTRPQRSQEEEPELHVAETHRTPATVHPSLGSRVHIVSSDPPVATGWKDSVRSVVYASPPKDGTWVKASKVVVHQERWKQHDWQSSADDPTPTSETDRGRRDKPQRRPSARLMSPSVRGGLQNAKFAVTPPPEIRNHISGP
jgi:hypothetical protein